MNLPSTPAEYGQLIMNFAPIILMVLIFYFLLIRPQRKRDKADREMKSSLKIGDNITTIGGIMGKIVNMKDEEQTVVIETSSDRTKMEFRRSAIASKDTSEEKKS